MKMANQNHPYQNEDFPGSGEDSFLPSPEILAKYRNSGMARELLGFVKSEQEQRHRLQEEQLRSYRRGQRFGLVLSLFFLWGVFQLAKSGHSREAYTLSGIFVFMVLAVTLVTGRRRKMPTRRGFGENARPRGPYPPRPANRK
jgi:uncharacterized membrane protein